jgi:hypothetical protein
MADLVTPAHKSGLSPRNSEPTHLTGASYETLGGRTITSVPNSDEDKIDAGKGISTDTTIPKAVGPEASHLKTEDNDTPDVSFDGDDDLAEGDDLDAELDQFESLDTNVDVDLDESSDDDDVVKEDEDKDDKEAVNEDDEKADDKEAVNEDDNPFEKKDGDDEVNEDENPFAKKDDDEKVNEDENPFAKKDDDKDKEVVKEGLKIRIKLPVVKLNESVIPAKNQKKVAVLFEQHVRAVSKQITTQVAAHYKKLHESKLAKRDAVLAKQMDSYLSYVVEEWVKSNRVAVRQSLRAQLAEEFLGGLHKLFTEHYIDVPESKVDVVKQLTEQVETLKKTLNEQHASKLKLRKLAEAANKARIVSDFARNMSVAEAAKLQKLAEDTQYKTAKDFRAKLTVLKESYFPKTTKKTAALPEADVKVLTEEKTQPVSDDADVQGIVEILTQQAANGKW